VLQDGAWSGLGLEGLGDLTRQGDKFRILNSLSLINPVLIFLKSNLICLNNVA
jgi:hypothetical protein